MSGKSSDGDVCAATSDGEVAAQVPPKFSHPCEYWLHSRQGTEGERDSLDFDTELLYWTNYQLSLMNYHSESSGVWLRWARLLVDRPELSPLKMAPGKMCKSCIDNFVESTFIFGPGLLSVMTWLAWRWKLHCIALLVFGEHSMRDTATSAVHARGVSESDILIAADFAGNFQATDQLSLATLAEQSCQVRLVIWGNVWLLGCMIVGSDSIEVALLLHLQHWLLVHRCD